MIFENTNKSEYSDAYKKKVKYFLSLVENWLKKKNY